MEIGRGKRVKVKYQCRLQDGKTCHLGESDTIQFFIGDGMVPPSFERAITEMQIGERRQIRIPAAEVRMFKVSKTVQSEIPPGVAYDFAPGEGGGDVGELVPPGLRHPRRPEIPPGSDIELEIELLGVEDPTAK